MNTTINNPKIANLALTVVVIISVVVASVGAGFLEGVEWLGFLFIAASILGLAYFLPETATRRFSSRQSALGGSCLFLYLAISSGMKVLAIQLGSTASDLWFDESPMLVALVVSYIFYWVCLWTIRGLRAPKNVEEVSGGNGGRRR